MPFLQAVRLECVSVSWSPGEGEIQLVQVIRAGRLVRYDQGEVSEIFTKTGRWIRLDHAAKKVTVVNEPAPWLSPDSKAVLRTLTDAIQWVLRLSGSRASIKRSVKSAAYLGLPCQLVTATAAGGYPLFQTWLCEIDSIRLPLKVVLRLSREDLVLWDTLSLQRERVPDNLFTVPAGYEGK